MLYMNMIYIELPNDILNHIMTYIPCEIKLLLNRLEYIKHHNNVIYRQLKLSNVLFDNYIKYILKNDLYFVFNQLLNDNFQKWIHMKNYRIIGIKFKNYLYFLIYLSKENNANKCLDIISNTLYNTGLNIKQPKNKFINRDIIWTK